MALLGSQIRYNYIVLAVCVTALLAYLSLREHNAYMSDSSHRQHSGDLLPLDPITGGDFAYATFLANWPQDGEEDPNDDKYFVATRILAYQLLHAPETRTTHDYPLIVLVNDHVSTAKRERLAKDGAIVWEPKPVDGKWIHNPNVSTWEYVMTKLRIWELTQFSRICFMDADTILSQPLDAIFLDAAVSTHPNLNSSSPAPSTYALAGMPENKGFNHHWPPLESELYPHYMNAGFFVLQPSLEMLDYYLSFTETPGVFAPEMPEQNLLNFVHAPEGSLPWQTLGTRWNIHSPTWGDWAGGVRSVHARFWETRDEELKEVFESWRWRMEGFFEGLEG